jgi:4-hydroxybenzoate polyprenyltransferase
MNPYIRIVRPINLAVIILTLLLVRFCLVEVYLGLSGVRPALTYLGFSLLVLAVVLIAAGGYVINDVLDQTIDRANKPNRRIVGRSMTQKKAMTYYWVLSLAGNVLGFYLALQVDYLILGFVFPATTLLLWFYSSRYQKTMLIGNLFISFLSALVIMTLWLFEFFALKTDTIHFVDALSILPFLQYLIFGYALFAFLVSLSREIIKDMEDLEGDRAGGYRTLPIVLGIPSTKRIVVGIHLLTMALLGLGQFFLFQENLTLVFWYLSIAVQVLFIFVLYQLTLANGKKDFHFLSNAYKLIMLAGILSMQLFYISY